MITTIYTLNRVQVKKGTNLTPYELWFGHAPSVKYFKIFGSKCYILKDNRNGKLESKGEEGILLGYSMRSKTYKCLNTNTNKVMESANVNFDNLVSIQKMKKLRGLPKLKKLENVICKKCQSGKKAKSIFKNKKTTYNEIL